MADGAALLEIHRGSKFLHAKSKHDRGTAGIFVYTVDKDTRNAYVLMGVNHKGEYCHFHGWIDQHESSIMGAAREGYEESSGVFGSYIDIYCYLLDPHTQMTCPSNDGFAMMVNLGETTKSSRLELTRRFLYQPAHIPCMMELVSVNFLELKALREVCTKFAEVRSGVMNKDTSWKSKCNAASALCEKKFYVGGLQLPHPDIDHHHLGHRLREFLHHWYFCDIEFWTHPALTRLVDEGVAPQPPLSKVAPQIADLFGAELRLTKCELCQEWGHSGPQCWDNPLVRRWGDVAADMCICDEETKEVYRMFCRGYVPYIGAKCKFYLVDAGGSSKYAVILPS